MSVADEGLARVTYADLAVPGDGRAEIIHGSIVPRTGGSGQHAYALAAIASFVGRRFDRKPGGRWPGGWWAGIAVDVEYSAHEMFCHDVAGWRRERVAEPPPEGPMRVRPDWVCEVLCPADHKRDLVEKFEVLRAAGMPHYWILDPEEKVLTVHRLQPEGYLVLVTASSGQTVRAEPFHEVELPVGVLFGDEDEEE